MKNKYRRASGASSRSEEKRARTCGFTLIELLTVIAVIGILAALIMATVGAVRKSAYKARSISNLRQIQQGLALYDQGNRRLPQLAASSAFGEPLWNQTILPYMGIQSSPEEASDPWRTQGRMPSFFYDPAAETSNLRRGDYGVIYSNTDGPVKLTQPSLSMMSLRNPSRTPLVVTAQQLSSGVQIGSWYALNSAVPQGTGSEVAGRHNGASIIAFADGHVRVLPKSEFYDQYMPFSNN